MEITMYEYENVKRVSYNGNGHGDATFIPVCTKCGRFVKADRFVMVNDMLGLFPGYNATCRRCGRVNMIFEGFF